MKRVFMFYHFKEHVFPIHTERARTNHDDKRVAYTGKHE